MLRSGKQLPEVGIEKEEKEVAKDIHKEERQTKEYIEEKESKKEEVPKNFTPPLPFPQRQQRTKNDKHFGEVFKGIPITQIEHTDFGCDQHNARLCKVSKRHHFT